MPLETGSRPQPANIKAARTPPARFLKEQVVFIVVLGKSSGNYIMHRGVGNSDCVPPRAIASKLWGRRFTVAVNGWERQRFTTEQLKVEGEKKDGSSPLIWEMREIKRQTRKAHHVAALFVPACAGPKIPQRFSGEWGKSNSGLNSAPLYFPECMRKTVWRFFVAGRVIVRSARPYRAKPDMTNRQTFLSPRWNHMNRPFLISSFPQLVVKNSLFRMI